MASNKKVFTIEINGLSESVKSVGALQERIDALQKSLKGMGKSKIKIGEGSGDAEYNKLLAEREKLLKAVNKEMGDSGKTLKEYKKETKELVALEEKARNEAKGYANTLSGLKTELKDLKNTIQNVDINSEEYVKMSESIYNITQQLKNLEEAQGTFKRNVGNYKSATEHLDAMGKAAESAKEKAEELPNILAKLQQVVSQGGTLSMGDIIGQVSLNDLKNELNSVKKAMDDAVGEDDYNNLKKYYDQLNKVTEEFKELRGEVQKTGAKLKTEITRTINGQVYTWETLTQAVGELEDKLYQLAANGERNTDEFKDIAKAAAELKVELRQVDYQIDSMVESSTGINKMMSMTQGFTALAQGAVGIGQLFGMDSENSQRGIQTMMAIQGIVSALQQVQEQIQKGSAFGKMMEKWVNYMKMFSTWTIFSSNEFKKFRENLTAGYSSIEGIDTATANWIDKSSKMMVKSKKHFLEYVDIYKKIESLGGSVDKNLGGIAGLLKALRELEASSGSSPELNDLFNRVRDLNTELGDLVSIFDGGDEKKKFFTEINRMASNAAIGFKQFGTAILNAIKPANLLNTTFKLLNVTLKATTLAIKSFAKATIILAAFQVLVEIIGWISDIIGKAYEWIKGNDKLVNSLGKVETELDLVNKSIERYLNTLQHLRDTNKVWMTDTEMATIKLEKLERELLKATKALMDFSNVKGGGKSLLDNLTNGDTWFQDSVDSMDEFRKRYEDLMKAVEAGEDITSIRGGSWWQQLWSTKSDAKADLGEMQIAVIKDLQNTINNLDLSKGTEEIKRFYDMLQDPMYASSFANLENLFPEEEWAQVLKKRVEQVIQMYEQFDEAAKDSVKIRLEEEKRLTEELVAYQTNIAKRVRDNDTEALEDKYERELQALKNAKRDELNEAQGNLELIVSINKKYNRLEQEMLKNHLKEKLEKQAEKENDITNILRQIRDNRLSAEEESLDKHLQELENQRQDAIEDARKQAEEAAREGKDLTELYNQLVLSINIKYDALVKKEKEQYYNDLLAMYEDYARAMKQLELDDKVNILDNKSQDIDIKYNEKLNSSSGSFDFSAKYGKLIQEEKKYYQDRLNIELEYLEEKKKLDEEYAKFDKEDATYQEQIRYEDALKNLIKFKEDGKATEEEYNQLVERETELHNQTIMSIELKYNNDLTTINNEYLNDRKSMISQSLAESAQLYDEFAREVNDIMKGFGTDLNAFGVIDYKSAKAQLEKAQQAVEEGVSAIDAEISNLERKLRSKQITYADYKDARQQLESTKKELEEQGKDITKIMSGLLTEVCSQWKGLVDSWVSQISSLLSTLNETQMQLIDNQLAEIEHQLEIQEEAYEKAEEAAQAHKDKMDGIEDELADARGSRRQFLIDTLAAQQAAYLEDVAAQEKAAQEKEKLEEKQKALEKKRNEQEKKAKVQQAMINTYMAVSNALAVQPWFVGLALSAVALALGLKNVSAIKATPVYEDGGVIQGARHSQGGVKVLGGQAEVEGGEFITNRKSTAANLPLLTYINDNKRTLTAEDLLTFFSNGTPTVKSKLTRKFASGGQLPTTDGSEVNRVMAVSDASEGNKTYIVQVTDIINAQKNLERVQVLSGLVNE